MSEPVATLIRLQYIGRGAYFVGVPAADHDATPEDAETLVASGLYQVATPASPDGPREE